MTISFDLNSMVFVLGLIGIAVTIYRSYRGLFRIFILAAIIFTALISVPQLINMKPSGHSVYYLIIPVVAWLLLAIQGWVLVRILESSVGGKIDISGRADRYFAFSFAILATALLAWFNPLGNLLGGFYAGLEVGWMRATAVYAPGSFRMGLLILSIYLLAFVVSAYFAVRAIKNGTRFVKLSKTLAVVAIIFPICLGLLFLFVRALGDGFNVIG